MADISLHLLTLIVGRHAKHRQRTYMRTLRRVYKPFNWSAACSPSIQYKQSIYWLMYVRLRCNRWWHVPFSLRHFTSWPVLLHHRPNNWQTGWRVDIERLHLTLALTNVGYFAMFSYQSLLQLHIYAVWLAVQSLHRASCSVWVWLRCVQTVRILCTPRPPK